MPELASHSPASPRGHLRNPIPNLTIVPYRIEEAPMATQNRGTRIAKIITQVKKAFKPVAPPKNRTLIEHLLFACLLENSPHEAAEQAFETLQTEYFDWNEVRVSTKRELAETLKGLVDPPQAAERLKRTLHSVFESVYAFDLEPLKKQNLGQATKQIEKYTGTTSFAVAYVTQNALGGHAIPANSGLLISFIAFDLLTPAEASKGIIPGLERAISKSKGYEVGTILHQLGVEVGRSPYGANARKLLVTIDPASKDRLPKRPEPPTPTPEPVKPNEPAKQKPKPATTPKEATVAKEAAPPKSAPAKAAPKSAAKTAPKVEAKPVTKKKAAPPADVPAKKTPAKPVKPPADNKAPKKTSKGSGTPAKKKTTAKTATKKITKSKPR